jgi:hypothetical protein
MLATCLEEHGVRRPIAHDAPTLRLKSLDGKVATRRHALRACMRSIARTSKPTKPAHPATPAVSRPFAKTHSTLALPLPHVPARVETILERFAACTRAHGVPSFPAPEGVGFNVSRSGLNSATPTYKAAAAACGPILQSIDPAH